MNEECRSEKLEGYPDSYREVEWRIMKKELKNKKYPI